MEKRIKISGPGLFWPGQTPKFKNAGSGVPWRKFWIGYISFLPAITSTSTRMHGEFLRLLFLQAHRETTAHFTALGMPAQQHCDSFRYRRAAFYNGLKSKVGLAAAKAAALRVNLNINGCSIVAPPARSSRSSRACLTDSVLSHSLPMPHVH